MAAHIVIAPDKFKGSLSAAEAARAIAQGLRRRNPTLTTVECPIADGGEGTLSAALAVGFQAVEVYAPGPTGDMIRTAYARRGDTALVEMASVSGLGRMVGGVREPLRASSRGLGVVVSHALDDGCSHIVIGIGGSAGTDGGAGFLRGLGAELIDEAGNSVPEGGGGLASASALDLTNLHPGLADAALLIASDVDNPLCGPHGAAAIYGPQKGARPDQVVELDAGLSHWADLVAQTTGRDLRNVPGAGAAGGVGFAAIAVVGAEIRPGVDVILDMVGLHNNLDGAIALVTGEGCLDGQSLRGKAPIGVGMEALASGVPAFAIVGISMLTACEVNESPFAAVYSLHDYEPDAERSMVHAGDLLGIAAGDLAENHLNSLARP